MLFSLPTYGLQTPPSINKDVEVGVEAVGGGACVCVCVCVWISGCLCNLCQSMKLDPYVSLFFKASNELHIHCSKEHT